MPLRTFPSTPMAGSSRSDGPITHLNPLSCFPYATRYIVADYLQRGHPDCVTYSISSWPESVLPEAHWQYFDSLPAITLDSCTVILRLPSHHRRIVRSSSQPFVTVADILRSLYDVRAHFPNNTLLGFTHAGLNHLIVHLDL
jgi:hypothetical protein